MLSKSITQWEDNYEAFGDVAPPSGLRGRSRVLTTLMTDDRCQISELPFFVAEACFTAVTAEKARGWYREMYTEDRDI